MLDPDAIRAARRKAGVNQAELAEKAGVSPQTVCRAERDGVVSRTTAGLIAKALGTTIGGLQSHDASSTSASEDMTQLLALYDRLGEIQRAMVQGFVIALASTGQIEAAALGAKVSAALHQARTRREER